MASRMNSNRRVKKKVAMFTSLALSAGLIVSGITLGGAKADDAFVADPYVYNGSDPLGVATHFHLFAKNNITSSVHTHGNVAADTFYGVAEIGSRERFNIAEVSYVGTGIYSFATSSVADTLVVDSSYRLVSGENGKPGQKILADANGNQIFMDHVTTVLFEKVGAPYIDLDSEFKKLEQLSASYSTQGDSGTVKYSLVADQNDRWIDFSGASVDSNTYVNISYADWSKYSSRIVLKGLDNDSSHNGAVVINIDAAGLNEIELAPSDQEAFDRNGNAYAKNEKGSEEYGTLRLIYNIYDSSASNRVYTGNVSFSTSGFGSILAPGAQLTVSGVNGTAIGSSIIHTGGESHRMDVVALSPIEEETEAPTEIVTEAPTEIVTEAPTEIVTEAPTEEETEAPTEEETEAPTEEETEAPTEEETEAPTEEETEAPTEEETEAPTEEETAAPTEEETEAPTEEETEAPTEEETEAPTEEVTEEETTQLIIIAPTEEETEEVTEAPTEEETEAPTEEETVAPTEEETEAPTEETAVIIIAPTEEESEAPTEAETAAPTEEESVPVEEESETPFEAVVAGVGDIVIDVVDEDTEKGVAGVTVEVVDKKGEVVEVVKTDEQGKAAVEDVPAGDYKVIITEHSEEFVPVKPVQAVKVLGDTVTQSSNTLGSSVTANATSQTVVLGIENKNSVIAVILFILGGLALACTGYLAFDIYGKR